MDAATLDGDDDVNSVAIPWSALTLDAAEKRFLLDIGKDRLEDAPGFAMADRWAMYVHAYYDVQRYWEDENGLPRNSDKASARRYPPLP